MTDTQLSRFTWIPEMEKYLHAAAIHKIYPGEDITYRVLALLQQHPQITRQDIFDCLLEQLPQNLR